MASYKALGFATVAVLAGYSYSVYGRDENEDTESESRGEMDEASEEMLFGIVSQFMPDPTATAEFSPGRILAMEYAVRGVLPTTAHKIEREMRQGKKFPFDKILFCNIGNPIAVGHKPYTYIRKLLSGYWSGEYDHLPDDLQQFLRSTVGSHSSGAYSHHRGVPGFLKKAEQFLDNRDAQNKVSRSCIAKHTQVFLTDGASGGVTVLIELLIDSEASTKMFRKESEKTLSLLSLTKRLVEFNSSSKKSPVGPPASGVFVPIPQYPLYSATITRLGGSVIPYELDEVNNWAVPSTKELELTYSKAVEQGVFPKAFVVINPGNPSGNVMSREDLLRILRFCDKFNLVVLADEVYQDNIWIEDKQFNSLRSISFEEDVNVKLASLHSCSKGLYGECGVRGGFVAFDNFPQHFIDLLDKVTSVRLCPNLTGQVAIAAVCTPPEGESRATFLEERESYFTASRAKAKLLCQRLNELEGVVCQTVEGAMYAFPKITIPKKAIQLAKKQRVSPDTFYCLEMLYETGVVTVPGSGFSQQEGTYHYRMTILPQLEELERAFVRMKTFHGQFLQKYGPLEEVNSRVATYDN